MGRCSRSLNTRTEEIWYGVLEMHTSKYGSSAFIKTPIMISRRRWSGLQKTPLVSTVTQILHPSCLPINLHTFPEHAFEVQQPILDPFLQQPPFWQQQGFWPSSYRYRDQFQAQYRLYANLPKERLLAEDYNTVALRMVYREVPCRQYPEQPKDSSKCADQGPCWRWDQRLDSWQLKPPLYCSFVLSVLPLLLLACWMETQNLQNKQKKKKVGPTNAA